ncbi:MAG: hypothetical protein JNL01_02330 [Bdellovibrionales bacterium]|nr:hypothetical protein [Bdellovibrionales bacterium]
MKILNLLGPLALFIGLGPHAFPQIRTNAVIMTGAPSWVTESKVNKITDKIESKLEWDIRKIQVIWHTGSGGRESFKAAHGLSDPNDAVMAFARKSDFTVHLGPKIDRTNFDKIFGHELVHVILAQKYKSASATQAAIPSWLEEGLANYLAGYGKTDFKKLAARGNFPDFHQMIHPFGKTSANSVSDHYELSKALVEFIASKCSLLELIQLSVGKNLENYLPTFCSIQDLNGEFAKWVKKKSKSMP